MIYSDDFTGMLDIFDEKKLSIKHYLYKHNTKREQYPVYIQIVFDRKVTQVRSSIQKLFKEMSNVEKQFKHVIIAERRMITDIIREEYNENYNSFTLKGINTIIKKYFNNIFEEYEKVLTSKVFEISKYASVNQNYIILPRDKKFDENFLNTCRGFYGDKISLIQLEPYFKSNVVIQEIGKLFKDSDSINLFEWIYMDGKKRFKEYSSNLEYSNAVIEYAIKNIDEIING